MDRIVMVEIAGQERPLLFSMDAMKAFMQRYGSINSLDAMLNNIPQEKKVSEFIWILSVLLDQGSKYQKMQTGEDNKPPTFDQLGTTLGFFDLIPIVDKLAESLYKGALPSIKVQPPKKV